MADPNTTMSAMYEIGVMIHPFKGSIGTIIMFTMFMDDWNTYMNTQDHHPLTKWVIFMMLTYVLGGTLMRVG